MADHDYIFQAGCPNEARQPADVRFVAEVTGRARLVRAAEPHQVWRHDAASGRHQRCDSVPEQVGPRRLPMQHQHHRRGRVSLVEVVQAKGAKPFIHDRHVVRLEVIILQAPEPLIRRA